MKRGVVNPKPIIKKAPVLYLINYPATISFILHRRSKVSGGQLLLSNKCDSPPGGAEDVDVLVFVIGVHESMDSRRCSFLHDL